MSGHSKWATIHRQKEVKDAKRGAVFTKLAAAITLAVKEGGGVTNIDQNFKLRLAVDRARQLNMPKENIQRSIDRAAGAGGNELVQAVFEGFLPGGAAVLVETLTDNKLRTAQSVREVLEKSGGVMAGQNAVGYMFAQSGELRINNKELRDEDELKFIDMGAKDIERGEEEWTVYCDSERTFEVKDRLANSGYVVEGAELVFKPTSVVDVPPAEGEKVMAVLEKLSEVDDVHKVYTNANFVQN